MVEGISSGKPNVAFLGHVCFLDLNEPDAGVNFHAIARKGESRKTVLTLLNECRRIAGSKFSVRNEM